jgi:hypothetical protein
MNGKWIAAGVVAVVVSSAAVVLVQSTGPAGNEQQQQDEKTVSGCMRTGSSPTVYLLRGGTIGGAEAPAQSGSQQTEDYLLVTVPDTLNLSVHVNHRVAITGVVSPASAGPPPPTAANAAEKAMQRLAVKSLKMIAQNCAAIEKP